MRISRVHVEAELVVGDSITFDQDRGHYLKHVLRLKPGAAVDLFNGDGNDYRATLAQVGKQLIAEVESQTLRNTESKIHTTLLQAIGKADRLDWMIQKTAELGVNRIVLFNAEHTQHPLKSAQMGKKLVHWRAVAISACEQCGRARLPLLEFSQDLSQAFLEASSELQLILDLEGTPLSTQLVQSARSVTLLIGPEGGLRTAERDRAVAAGFRQVSLGSRILRFETAATAALGIVQSADG